MPEGLEAELYRRAAEPACGRPIASVDIDDRQAMAAEIGAALVGATFVQARRIGKLVLLDTDLADGTPRRAGCLTPCAPAATLGMHFGMTGRLIVDDAAPIAALEYGSRRDDPAWDRFVVRFADGGVLRVNDPRRWATFMLDPAEGRLGPDFLDVTAEYLAAAFARRRAAVKTVLLDQSVVAGYGNLCVDEVLWQAGISPSTPARDLSRKAIGRLVELARPHLLGMLARGGSHRGTIDPELRASLPPCPRDGAPLRRDQIGGRTTVWCPVHQTGGPHRGRGRAAG
jgi:formamidopyrimidine-DNA glycosylase